MFLHGSNFLKREAGCIYHEGKLCRVDPLEVITFNSDDEKDEKDQETGYNQPRYTTSRKWVAHFKYSRTERIAGTLRRLRRGSTTDSSRHLNWSLT